MLRRALHTMALIAVLPAAGLALIVSSADASHQKRIFVIGNHCRGHDFRPSRISLQCPYETFTVDSLTYTSYGGRIARATGFFSETCGSSCGQGGISFKHLPGSVTLKDVIRCQGRLYYGSISWRYGSSTGTGGNGGALIGPSAKCRDYWDV